MDETSERWGVMWEEEEEATRSEGLLSLRYHFLLSRPLVMGLPVQRFTGAVSPTTVSTT